MEFPVKKYISAISNLKSNLKNNRKILLLDDDLLSSSLNHSCTQSKNHSVIIEQLQLDACKRTKKMTTSSFFQSNETK